MSKTPRLDPLAAARLKAKVRCMDCASSVHIVENDYGPGHHRGVVRHDSSCPMLAGLRRDGLGSGQIQLARADDESAEAFAQRATSVAADLSRRTGRTVELRADSLTGDVLGSVDGSTFRTSPRGARGTGRGRGRR